MKGDRTLEADRASQTPSGLVVCLRVRAADDVCLRSFPATVHVQFMKFLLRAGQVKRNSVFAKLIVLASLHGPLPNGSKDRQDAG